VPLPGDGEVRLSCARDDPGFDERAALFAAIYLDDQPQRHCITADEEAGFIIRYAYVGGVLQLVPGTREPLTELLRGRVRIELDAVLPGAARVPLELG